MITNDIENDSCELHAIHEDAVEAARLAMPPSKILFNLADLFKIFADFTRIKILSALQNGELCVCDIASLLSVTKSAVSHQLRILRQAKLVRPRREGKIVYYSLDDDHVASILAQGIKHTME